MSVPGLLRFHLLNFSRTLQQSRWGEERDPRRRELLSTCLNERKEPRRLKEPDQKGRKTGLAHQQEIDLVEQYRGLEAFMPGKGDLL